MVLLPCVLFSLELASFRLLSSTETVHVKVAMTSLLPKPSLWPPNPLRVSPVPLALPVSSGTAPHLGPPPNTACSSLISFTGSYPLNLGVPQTFILRHLL